MLHPVSSFISEYFYYVFLAVLVLNLLQRKYRKDAAKKRSATLYLAVANSVVFVFAEAVVRFNLSELLLIPFGVVVAGLCFYSRRVVFPFSLRCSECRQTLDFNRMVYSDSNLCLSCAEKRSEALAEPSDGP